MEKVLRERVRIEHIVCETFPWKLVVIAGIIFKFFESIVGFWTRKRLAHQLVLLLMLLTRTDIILCIRNAGIT